MEHKSASKDKQNEFSFGYSRLPLFLRLWCACSLIALIPSVIMGGKLLDILENRITAMFGPAAGLLTLILLAVFYLGGLINGSLVLSAGVTNQKGKACFFDDYVMIALEKKKYSIAYCDIKGMSCTPVFSKSRGLTGYRFTLRAKGRCISFNTSKEDSQKAERMKGPQSGFLGLRGMPPRTQIQNSRYELQDLYEMIDNRWKQNPSA